MSERGRRRRRALRAIDDLGDSMETSIRPWLVMTVVVGVPVLIWALVDVLVDGWPVR